MRRLAVARLEFAANSFAPRNAGRAEFERCEWRSGAPARGAEFGGASELSALHEFTSLRPDWQVSVLRCASAPPAGPMDDELFTAFYDEVLAGLAAGSWDAVYLSLHGACLTTRRTRPELSLIAAVRNEVGRAALGASFDPHGNIAPDVARYLTFASAHRRGTDRRATALRVLGAIADTAEGRLAPVGAVAKVDALLPGTGAHADEGPLAEVEAAASRLEEGAVLDVSAFCGFPYGDTPDAGGAGMAFADGDPAAARRAAAAVATALYQRRSDFAVQLPSPAAAIAVALAEPSGLVCLADRADDPESGGMGDTPGLLQALLAARLSLPTVFAFFCDPALVARAREAGIGAVLGVELGGRVDRAFGDPVAARAAVTRIGEPADCCVLDVEGIAVVVAERGDPLDDARLFARLGINLAATRLLCVKGRSVMRPALSGHVPRFIEVDVPGPAGLDLARLPYRKVPPDLLPRRPAVTRR